MTKKYQEITDVTLSLCYSHLRANLSEIGYESIPEEHVITSFSQMGPTPKKWER